MSARFASLARVALTALAVAAAACRPASAYPEGPYGVVRGGVLPDLAFEGALPSGARGAVHLHDYLAPPGGPASLLVVEVSGGLWCGTCRWYASHEGEITAGRGPDRLERLSVILGDRDNAPARPEDAQAWQQAFALRGTAVAADPGVSLGALLEGRGAPLPLFVLVDRRSMRVAEVLSNPAPEHLTGRIEAALATLDGEPAPPPPEEVLVAGAFRRNEWDLLTETTLPAAPPPDPTNAVADAPAARALGRALFFDLGLSPSQGVACASCHDPAKGLSDGRAVARGAGIGDRRTPAIGLAAHARWQFWDGRADTLWAQALGPLEDAREMGGSRVLVAQRIASAHSVGYARAFPDPPLPEASGWPAQGKPGEPAFEAMSAGDRDAATQVFVNAGKAIAAYERTFTVKPNRLDAYLRGDRDALDPLERYGLLQFARAGCLQCHWGPRLTDDAFHDTRTATGRRDGTADRGRLAGVAAWRASPFRADGPWSDDPDARPAPRNDAPDALLGQLRTPPLRGVADLSHWGHGGAEGSLAAVTEAYGKGGVPAGDPSSAGPREPWLPLFGETVQWALVPFLKTLTAEPSAP